MQKVVEINANCLQIHNWLIKQNESSENQDVNKGK